MKRKYLKLLLISLQFTLPMLLTIKCVITQRLFFGHQRDTIFAAFCRSNCFRPRISSVRATCKCITLRLITFVTRHKPASPLVRNPSPRTKICKGLFIRYYNPTGFLSSLNTRSPHLSHSIEEFVLSIAPLLFSLYCIPSFSFFFIFSVYAGRAKCGNVTPLYANSSYTIKLKDYRHWDQPHWGNLFVQRLIFNIFVANLYRNIETLRV